MIHLIYINLILNAFVMGSYMKNINDDFDHRAMRIGVFVFGLILGFEFIIGGLITEYSIVFKNFLIRITQIKFYFKFKNGKYDNLPIETLNNIAFGYYVVKNEKNWTWNCYLKCSEKVFKHNNYDPKTRSFIVND